uniref:Secreted protein n=1 Tax=Triticum urartu TaxID=4572 RepID=A0A8R7RAZ4_TRIUA
MTSVGLLSWLLHPPAAGVLLCLCSARTSAPLGRQSGVQRHVEATLWPEPQLCALQVMQSVNWVTLGGRDVHKNFPS